ncbi:unnamed protein product, partial [Ixodes hexagonus]
MTHPAEFAVFGVLMTAILGLGLFFAFRRKLPLTVDEMFLGSRTLQMVPLALSVLATIVSSTGIISFTAHFYAYGMNMVWSLVTYLTMIPVTVHLIIPVLYRLKVTSIFEYLRARYGSKISFTACIIYFFLTESGGAAGIAAAAMAISTIFHVSFIWCCLAIGLTGTVYTALGGLRGVVWTDCAQAVVSILAPLVIIAKISYDSNSGHVTLRPVSSTPPSRFFINARIDFTQDENLWACLIGLSSMVLYRVGIDQMLVQRYLASRTLKDAQRTARVGTSLVTAFYFLLLLMAFSIIYWFRDCDPQLAGAIRHVDQILPFYVKRRLSEFPGFSGLFLAGVVSATTSTISSMINSQAAVLYIDVVSQFITITDAEATRVTKCLAFAVGSLMTLYSLAIPYMGSATRIVMMVYSATTGPFVGLFLMALIFPCVNSKGAGTATLLMVIYQLWHLYETLRFGVRPERMPVTVDYCPGNISVPMQAMNQSTTESSYQSRDAFIIFKLSSYWSGLLSTVITMLLGVLISVLTGKLKTYKKKLHLTSDVCLRFWRRTGLIPAE